MSLTEIKQTISALTDEERFLAAAFLRVLARANDPDYRRSVTERCDRMAEGRRSTLDQAIDFYHYDLYSQALAKIERGHGRDLMDVDAMLDRSLVTRVILWKLFLDIEAELVRFPAIEPAAFRAAVVDVCRPAEGS